MAKHDYSAQNAQFIKNSYSGQSTQQIFVNNQTKQVDPLMSPHGLVFRESRDSANYPESIAIIIALDETGSMDDIPEYLVREKLPLLAELLQKHGVKDAAIMFLAVGDHYSDSYPIQVGQFESDEVGLNKWLTLAYLEANGGGNRGESYSLGWYVAARKTSIDCFEKRGVKGFYFSIGDEHCHQVLEADALKNLFGAGEYKDESSLKLLEEAQSKYEVFHIHCQHGQRDSSVYQGWKQNLGERAINLTDKGLVAEVIASTIAVTMGANLKDITDGFDSKTALVVQGALANISGGSSIKKQEAGGIVAL